MSFDAFNYIIVDIDGVAEAPRILARHDFAPSVSGEATFVIPNGFSHIVYAPVEKTVALTPMFNQFLPGAAHVRKPSVFLGGSTSSKDCVYGEYESSSLFVGSLASAAQDSVPRLGVSHTQPTQHLLVHRSVHCSKCAQEAGYQGGSRHIRPRSSSKKNPWENVQSDRLGGNQTLWLNCSLLRPEVRSPEQASRQRGPMDDGEQA
jgi:hypothetical protein